MLINGISRTSVMRYIIVVAAMVSGCSDGKAPDPIVLDNRVVVETLASDKFEGRLTGTRGIEMAADYIIEQLEEIGAQPLPGLLDFRLPFQFTAGMRDGGTTLILTEPEGLPQWSLGDIQALSFSETGSVTGDLVFAGYGLSVPDTDGFSYDSFATLDIHDKIVLVLRY